MVRPASFCCAAVVALAMLLATAPPTAAGAIQFTATNLTDLTVGEDLWSYEYFVNGFVFDVDQGFSVYFDPAFYADLESPPPSPPDWVALTIQPDDQLPSDGFYEVVALAPAPSLAGPFTVSFVWLGLSSPGAQRFTIDAFDAAGAYTELDAGVTTRFQVPEPAVTALLAAGAFQGWRRARRRRLLRN